jgi:hypothetical protein
LDNLGQLIQDILNRMVESEICASDYEDECLDPNKMITILQLVITRIVEGVPREQQAALQQRTIENLPIIFEALVGDPLAAGVN